MQLSTISLALTRLGGAFSPASLFAGGTAGTWYDPSDPTTLFTTSTGTTPCAVPGSGSQVLVGLMLDKSQGAPGALGAELVTNGDFPVNLSGWTTSDGTPTWVAPGAMQLNSTSARQSAYQDIATVAGKTYEIKATLSNFTGGGFAPRMNIWSGAFVSLLGSLGASAGSFVGRFTATASIIRLQPYADLGGIANFDNISVREIPGNHAIAFNDTTARPELSARVNLLTYSEQFDHGAWLKTGSASVTPNTTTAPNGTLTADTVTFTASGDYLLQLANVIAGTSYTFSAYVKTASGTSAIRLVLDNGVTETSNISVNDTWQQISFTAPASATGNRNFGLRAPTTGGTTLFIWGADLRPANIGSAIPSYQRIADQYTYDSNGFQSYLRFDGVDDSMYTPASIPFATVTSDGQARRNLLSVPLLFNSTPWVQTNVTVALNLTAAPDGTSTASALTAAATAATNFYQDVVVQSTTVTYSVYVKQNSGATEANTFAFYNNTTATTLVVFTINYATGAITQSLGSGATATAVGNGWWRVVFTVTSGISVGNSVRVYACFIGNSETIGESAFVWGAQLETGSTATAFQNIGTDKMSVFAGVRKLSDAAAGMVAELSTSVSTGAFDMQAPASTGGDNYRYRAGGTTIVSSGTVSGYAAPVSNVLTAQNDIGAPSISLRVNAVQIASNTSSQGTGNFGTYPLFIGSRNNAGVRFNGHLYSLIIAGTQLQSGSITATEQYVAGKTGVQI